MTLPRLDALHYLFTEDADGITAHCLDLDLVTSAEDRASAESRLNAMVRVQIAGAYGSGNFDLLFFKAPSEFWAKMDQASDLPKAHLRIDTAPPQYLPVEQRIFQVQLPVFRALTPRAA
ncbi:MAG: hypothetical protein WBQ72_12985 [Terriglobales bacterium]|jgi:hypothetical protein